MLANELRWPTFMADRNDTLLEQHDKLFDLEPGVSAMSWKVIENGAA